MTILQRLEVVRSWMETEAPQVMSVDDGNLQCDDNVFFRLGRLSARLYATFETLAEAPMLIERETELLRQMSSALNAPEWTSAPYLATRLRGGLDAALAACERLALCLEDGNLSRCTEADALGHYASETIDEVEREIAKIKQDYPLAM